MDMGYFGIGIENTIKRQNIGTLFRSALNFDADFIFTINRRYEYQSSDTTKTKKHLPLWHFKNKEDFKSHIPNDCVPVGVEIIKTAKNIVGYQHPERAIYILGAEDSGLSTELLLACRDIVYIPSNLCLNVSVAGAIVMYDRYLKAFLDKK